MLPFGNICRPFKVPSTLARKTFRVTHASNFDRGGRFLISRAIRIPPRVPKPAPRIQVTLALNHLGKWDRRSLCYVAGMKSAFHYLITLVSSPRSSLCLPLSLSPCVPFRSLEFRSNRDQGLFPEFRQQFGPRDQFPIMEFCLRKKEPSILEQMAEKPRFSGFEHRSMRACMRPVHIFVLESTMYLPFTWSLKN